MVDWHALSINEVLKLQQTSEKGLSNSEASSRLKKFGHNELKQIVHFSPIKVFLLQFNSVFVYILLFAAVFSLFIKHTTDFMVILTILLLNSIIGFFQQYKAEKIISELKDMLVPKVKVFRNGKLAEVLSSELVPGDIVNFSQGDKVMADCRILSTNSLEVNESVLTGESFPQIKKVGKLFLETELSDRENMLYMGTIISNGNVKAIVVSTGMQTEFGKIAGLVQKIHVKRTPLEEKLDLFSKKTAAVILAIIILMVLIGLFRGGSFYELLLTGVALAVSVIPEGLPAVVAITFALAIQRMRKHNSLIRKLPATETLGRTTVICTDKTGTLTEGEMSVLNLHCNKKNFYIEDNLFFESKKQIIPGKIEELKMLLKIGVMCNNALIERGDKLNIFGGPTETAIILSADKAGIFKKEETEKEKRVIEYSFSSKRKIMSIVRETNSGFISYVKGAPEIVLQSCNREFINGKVISLSEKRKHELTLEYNKMASQSLRVLAFAFKQISSEFNQSIAESNLVFVGFQGMMDLPRKEIKSALKECLNAGIKVKMFTGDSLLTAKAISDKIGLIGGGIEAKDLENISISDFDDIVREKIIFARITPEIKFKIIQSLKRQNEIVAVTGDGVNDILALKEAHIGIAMGIKGTDVAKDVSDIILLDDNFNSIVQAIKEGRRVYDNLKKSIKFHLAANVGELFVVFASFVFALPLPLLPLAILWMNLITDSLPSLALSVEKEEEDLMKRKPIQTNEEVLTNIWKFILIAGIISFISAFGLFLFYYQSDLEKARTMALTTSVFFELFLVFTCRSDKNIWKIGIFSNKFLLYSVLIAFLLQIIVIYTPFSAIFEFKSLSLFELILVILCSSTGFVFFEITKMIKKTNGVNQLYGGKRKKK